MIEDEGRNGRESYGTRICRAAGRSIVGLAIWPVSTICTLPRILPGVVKKVVCAVPKLVKIVFCRNRAPRGQSESPVISNSDRAIIRRMTSHYISAQHYTYLFFAVGLVLAYLMPAAAMKLGTMSLGGETVNLWHDVQVFLYEGYIAMFIIPPLSVVGAVVYCDEPELLMESLCHIADAFCCPCNLIRIRCISNNTVVLPNRTSVLTGPTQSEHSIVLAQRSTELDKLLSAKITSDFGSINNNRNFLPSTKGSVNAASANPVHGSLQSAIHRGATFLSDSADDSLSKRGGNFPV